MQNYFCKNVVANKTIISKVGSTMKVINLFFNNYP